ncbi:MAG: DUF1292 domain-containing protein [Oscillospiraceae bacterium]|nr:DUF1292 domain-containing protein [Oscillospiraceae bacterium]
MAEDLERMEGTEGEENIITLTMDDGSTLDCLVVGIVGVDEKDYIALMPLDGPDAEDGQVYVYGYSEDAEGEPMLEDIEDDAEFEKAAAAVDALLEELDGEE